MHAHLRSQSGRPWNVAHRCYLGVQLQGENVSKHTDFVETNTGITTQISLVQKVTKPCRVELVQDLPRTTHRIQAECKIGLENRLVASH
jgi:hypothetical protein